MNYSGLKISLLIPCHNEELTIASVIGAFSKEIDGLDINVYDNNSTDKTAQVATQEGAKVIFVKSIGKGNVVRRMFADIDADIYILVDGDSTYDAASIHRMLDRLILENLDMVVGYRSISSNKVVGEYRFGHQFGNRFLTSAVANIFGAPLKDMLSGYRVFSRRYVKSFPAISEGFEIETELTVHALELRMAYEEIPTPYYSRPENSKSKLSTYRDGFRIFITIFRLYLLERPLSFYSLCALTMAGSSVFIFIPLLTEYLNTGLVPRLPTAILSASMMVCALLLLMCGLILDNVKRGRHELKRLVYLNIGKCNRK